VGVDLFCFSLEEHSPSHLCITAWFWFSLIYSLNFDSNAMRSSGGEVLMCNEAIFGTDVDMLTWDYGMTDGGSTELLLHYGYRAAVHPNRPALVAIGSVSSARMARLQELASRGLAVLYDANDDEQWALYNVPDSAGLTEEELHQLPPLVRNFKCEDSIEKGAPYCSSEKYNMFACPRRKGRVSWHPGWYVLLDWNVAVGNVVCSTILNPYGRCWWWLHRKRQALHGYSIALFLANLLIDVLSELVTISSSEAFHPESRLAMLLLEEEQLYSSFLQKSLPPSANPNNIGGVNFELLFKGKSFCHTALLPSRARYLGHVGTPQRNTVTGRVEQYDIGIPQLVANTIAPTLLGGGGRGGSAMPLAYAPDERDDCELPTKIDFKDFFYTHYNHGWTKIFLPSNDAEAQAYNHDPTAVQGLILVRLSQCPQNKCQPGDLKSILPADGVEVQVNGKLVISVIGLLGMLLLQGDDGQYWTPNSQGRFEISMRVTVVDHFLRISSLVVY
jgi:hypothetical protein